MKTRDALGVSWDGEAAAGALFYGLWAGEILSPPTFSPGVWPSDAEVRPRIWWGEHWTAWLWEVRIRSWPAEDQWARVVGTTLEELVSAGAAVSWCAVEGGFVEPPGLFDPSAMSRCVWSCQSQRGTSAAAPALEGEFGYVSDPVLASLHEEVTSLLNGSTDGADSGDPL